jgi:hypothetical protein
LKIKKVALKEVEHHWHLELGKVQEHGIILETTLVHPKELSNKLRQPMIYSSLRMGTINNTHNKVLKLEAKHVKVLVVQ